MSCCIRGVTGLFLEEEQGVVCPSVWSAFGFELQVRFGSPLLLAVAVAVTVIVVARTLLLSPKMVAW